MRPDGKRHPWVLALPNGVVSPDHKAALIQPYAATGRTVPHYSPTHESLSHHSTPLSSTFLLSHIEVLRTNAQNDTIHYIKKLLMAM